MDGKLTGRLSPRRQLTGRLSFSVRDAPGIVLIPKSVSENGIYRAKADGADRAETLRRLSYIPGIYVPSLYGHDYKESGELEAIYPIGDAPSRVERQWVKNLDDFPAHTVVVTDETEFNLYLIETARGCGRHCRFCMAGYCFRRPRNRSLDVLKDAVKAAKVYGKRIGLMGAAISDYPEIDALSEYILSEELTMSVASFRADSATETMIRSLASAVQAQFEHFLCYR